MRPTGTPIPTAADVMTTSLITLTTKTTIFEAMRLLLKYKISGAPVLDEEGRVVGTFSERNCLAILTAGEFYTDDHREKGTVGDCMTEDFQFVAPDVDLYALAQTFLTHAVRRLPVLAEGELLGQVSRRDVIRVMDQLGKSRAGRKHYPDYREPSKQVGAKRSH